MAVRKDTIKQQFIEALPPVLEPGEQVLGRNCRFLQGSGTDPGDVDVLRRGLHGGRDVSVVLVNYRHDGSPFFNEVSVSPIRDKTERITHFVGTQTDVTARIDRSLAI